MSRWGEWRRLCENSFIHYRDRVLATQIKGRPLMHYWVLTYGRYNRLRYDAGKMWDHYYHGRPYPQNKVQIPLMVGSKSSFHFSKNQFDFDFR
jgi:hypothetical protein